MNNYAPFTQKQIEYLKKCQDCWFNVAEGGKRGGKNVINGLAYSIILENHKSKIHLVAGYDMSSAKLNILDCDGYGVLNYFEGRYREGKYKNRDCLYIKTKTGEKVLLVSGGGKANSYKSIKGNTYGTVYITEANECHPTFIQEAFDRTLSSDDPKIFHDLNPKSPKHWYYTDILEFHEKKQKEDKNYGYNYEHFSIFDNLSVTDEQLKKRLNTYDKKSIWYLRDIEGQRIASEGILFPDIANDNERYYTNEIPANGIITVGVDFGGNGSNHAFTCAKIPRDYKELTFLKSRTIKINETEKMTQLIKEFKKFITEIVMTIGIPDCIFADSAEQLLMDALRTALKELQLNIPIANSIKTQINNRIHFYNILFMQDRIKFLKGQTESLVQAFSEAVQDPDEVEDRWLDDGTSDIDSLDSATYSCEKWFRAFSNTLI